VPSYDPGPKDPLGHHDMNGNDPYGHQPIDPVPYMESPNPEILGVPDRNRGRQHQPQQSQPQPTRDPAPPKARSPQNYSNADPMMNNPMNMNDPMDNHNMDGGGVPNTPPHGRGRSTKPSSSKPLPQETSKAQQPNSASPEPVIPFKEIAYDDQVEENVSVMESVGGPSLLLENLRNAQTIQRTVEPDIIAKYGRDFKPDLGLTREESIQLNPDRFYKHAVKKILERNEPEKVRLMDKLFDKYLGREEHLIRKLGARYAANEQQDSIDRGATTSSDGDGAYDGFKAFGGGDFSQSGSGSADKSNNFVDDNSAWQSHDVPQFGTDTGGPQFKGSTTASEMGGGFEGGRFPDPTERVDDDDHSSYSEESDYDSVDGTSPEVIAQVSELLNYVYGKTTVAGQIDRVSTIMRAYEGREAILLELLETKALLKANNEKGSLDDLPDSLKDNPGLQQNPAGAEVQVKSNSNVMSPMSNMTNPSSQQNFSPKHISPPKTRSPPAEQRNPPGPGPAISSSQSNSSDNNPFDLDKEGETPAYSADKKKKKGFFGRFKKKKGGKGEFPTNRGKSGALLGNQ